MNTKQHFIVIDDEPINNLLCDILIKHSVPDSEVELFSKASDALKYINYQFTQSKNDYPEYILLLDLNMPELTGWAFLEIFHKFEESIKSRFRIYILSSSIDHRDKSRADENPDVIGFLSKPLKREHLNAIMQKEGII